MEDSNGNQYPHESSIASTDNSGPSTQRQREQTGCAVFQERAGTADPESQNGSAPGRADRDGLKSRGPAGGSTQDACAPRPFTREEMEMWVFGWPQSVLVAQMSAHPTLQRVINIIESQYESFNLKPANVARMAGICEDHLRVIVRKATGLTVRQILTGYRLLKSMEDARFRDHKVIALAYDSGFANLGAFERNFKQVFGMTMKEYRKRLFNSNGKPSGEGKTE
jgi:AraC-like DNA-binding protein